MVAASPLSGGESMVSSLLEEDPLWSASGGGDPDGVNNLFDCNEEASCLLTLSACGTARLNATSTQVGFGAGVAVCDPGFDDPGLISIAPDTDGFAFFLSAFLVTERVSS